MVGTGIDNVATNAMDLRARSARPGTFRGESLSRGARHDCRHTAGSRHAEGDRTDSEHSRRSEWCRCRRTRSCERSKRYAPNIEAARLLALEVWPAVRQQHPDATLTLVGSEPTRTVQALASAAAGIVVTGAVPDVRPYLWSAAIAAAPIVTARGIQNKVLEAVAAGLPTVVTPNILRSLPPTLTGACVSAETAADLAAALVTLLAKSPEERRAIALTADTQSLRWERQLLPFGRLVEDACRTGRSRLDP
jgi:hypothetical protein